MHSLWPNPMELRERIEMEKTSEEIFRNDFKQAMEKDRIHTGAIKKGKRFRSAFTTEQVNYLENEYKKHPYIANTHRREVAKILNIPERAVKIWFQNRRMKEKKDITGKESDSSELDSPPYANDRNTLLLHKKQQLYGLPLLRPPEKNSAKMDIKKETTKNNLHVELVRKNSFEEPSSTKDLTITKEDYRNESQNLTKNNLPIYNSSAEFSIELCKKYRPNTESVIKSQQEKPSTTELKREKDELRPSQEYRKIQKSPVETTKYNNRSTATIQSVVAPPTEYPGNPYMPLYLKNYYTHPYLPAGNMLWKPVNVTPVMSTGMPTVIPTGHSAALSVAQEQNRPKNNCNCNCHDTQIAPINFHQTSTPQAQYIIAVPFPNPSANFSKI